MKERGYYSVTYGGDKIDDNDEAFSFTKPDIEVIKARFKAGINGKVGLVRLRLLNHNILEWKILKKPGSEFYPPKKALLHK